MRALSGMGVLLSAAATALLLSGCKTAEKQEDEPATTSAAASATTTATASAAMTASAAPVAVPVTAPHHDAGTGTDAGVTPIDAGVTPPGDAGVTVPDAGLGAAAAAAFKACSDKCQAILKDCAIPTPTKDGGPPQIKDPVACQAAATACFAACKP